MRLHDGGDGEHHSEAAPQSRYALSSEAARSSTGAGLAQEHRFGDGPETPKVRIGIIALTDCSEEDRKTMLMATHDVDEALFLADRLVMMTSGPAATVGEILSAPVPCGRAQPP